MVSIYCFLRGEGEREIMICQSKRGKSFVGQVMLLKGWLSVQDANNNE